MLQRLVVLVLMWVWLSLGCVAPVAAKSQQLKDDKHVAQIKKVVATIGIGREARIAIKRFDKTEVSGFVSEAADDHFVITDSATGATTRLTYAEVERAKPLPTVINELTPKRAFKQIGIAAGIGIGVLVLVCVVTRRCEE